MFMRWTYWILGLALLGMLIAPAALQPHVSVAAQAPQAIDGDFETASIWLAAAAFHVRDGSIAYGYTADGCVYAKSSADFVANVNLPDGATLVGAEYYFYDTDDQENSRIEISDFTIDPDYTIARELIMVESTDSAGYESATGVVNTGGGIPAPYVVNNRDYALAVEWYPVVFDTTMRLCGVRIDYIAPDPLDWMGTKYTRIAGSAFHRRDTATDYGYLGGGCTYIRSDSGVLTIDVDLPEQAELYGMRAYYRDQTDESSLEIRLQEYTGLGISNTLAMITTTNEITTYTDVYTDVTTVPYTVSETNQTLAVEVTLTAPTTDTLEFCGVRFSYGLPEPETVAAGNFSRFIAGSNFIAMDNGQSWEYAGEGCIYATNEIDNWTASVELPDRALVTSIVHYYRDTSAASTVLRLYETDGAGGFIQLAAVASSGNSGFGSNSNVLVEPYDVRADRSGLALVWEPGEIGSPIEFCGAQVNYRIIIESHVYLPMLRK